MSNLDSIVSVSISTASRTVSRKGFGTPMIAGYHTLSNDRVAEFEDLPSMVTAGHEIGDAIYLAAAAIFEQDPSPPSVKVGRRASQWTQVVDLTPATPSTGKVYSLTAGGDLITYTALVTDALSDVCTAFAAAVNAAADLKATTNTILATGGASAVGAQDYSGAQLNGTTGLGALNPPRAVALVFSAAANWTGGNAIITGLDANGATITDSLAIPNGGSATVNGTKRFASVSNIHIPAQGGAAGTFTAGVKARVVADGSSGTHVVITTQLAAPEKVSYAHDSTHSNLTLKNTTADAGIAADLTAIYLADPDFYGLCLDSNGAAEIEAAAAWAESTGGLMFVAQTCDTAVSDTVATSDLASVAWYLKSHNYFRTVLMFHPTIGEDAIAAAMLGNRLPKDPGGDTWKFKTLAGVGSYPLTATQITNMDAKNVIYTGDRGGVNVTLGAKVAAGEWCDVIRFRDWVVARMQEGIVQLEIDNEKIEYTDDGVELVKGRIESVIDAGIDAKGIAKDPKPTVTAPAVLSVDPALRAQRILPNVRFAFRLAGAIHAVQITGAVTS